MKLKCHFLYHGQAACGVYCEHNKLTVHLKEVTCVKCQQTIPWKNRKGSAPVIKPGKKPSDMVKKTKAWSMTQELWDWLESQPCQAETIVKSLTQFYENREAQEPQKPEISARDKIKNFLRDNPGWHDSYTIADALGKHFHTIQHLCKAMRRQGVEEKLGEGRSGKNLYRIKEES